MIVSSEKSKIFGVKFIVNRCAHDDRGTFMESFNAMESGAHELPHQFLQDNFSWSKKGTFRGLHIQRKNPQGKYVRCVKGSITDYFLDLRPGVPSFRQWGMFKLSAPNQAIYLPPGIAHGFFAHEDSIVHYKCTSLYDAESDGGVLYSDPVVGLEIYGKVLHVSDKDKNLPTMLEYLAK